MTESREEFFSRCLTVARMRQRQVFAPNTLVRLTAVSIHAEIDHGQAEAYPLPWRESPELGLRCPTIYPIY
jgi:hypothetical protein